MDCHWYYNIDASERVLFDTIYVSDRIPTNIVVLLSCHHDSSHVRLAWIFKNWWCITSLAWLWLSIYRCCRRIHISDTHSTAHQPIGSGSLHLGSGWNSSIFRSFPIEIWTVVEHHKFDGRISFERPDDFSVRWRWRPSEHHQPLYIEPPCGSDRTTLVFVVQKPISIDSWSISSLLCGSTTVSLSNYHSFISSDRSEYSKGSKRLCRTCISVESITKRFVWFIVFFSLEFHSWFPESIHGVIISSEIWIFHEMIVSSEIWLIHAMMVSFLVFRIISWNNGLISSTHHVVFSVTVINKENQHPMINPHQSFIDRVMPVIWCHQSVYIYIDVSFLIIATNYRSFSQTLVSFLFAIVPLFPIQTW